MIVYGDRRERVRLRPWLEAIRAQAAVTSDHGAIRDLLIEYGAFEAALADALFPDRDDRDRPSDQARAAALALGRAFAESWLEGAEAARPRTARFSGALAALDSEDLPEAGWRGVAEGYAFYALYPECYVAAARDFLRARNPERVVVIGLRGIGTSLSAAAAGAILAQGKAVSSYALRPRGHPFDRRLVLSEALRAEIARAAADAHVLIVDEGPGLSGSSLTGAAEIVSSLGVSDARIAFLPSWLPSGDGFVSEGAKARWGRHEKYVAEFEAVRPARALGALEDFADLSGGQWRRLLYPREAAWPAVQPQHERRKYLRAEPGPGAPATLFKFAGLGRYGKETAKVAEILAGAGWTPPVSGLRDGFLVQDWMDGRPLTRRDARAVLPRVASYVVFRRTALAANAPAPLDALFEMMAAALDETFGAGASALLDRFDRKRLEDAPAVAIDGRMLPHEWLTTADGRCFKTDALDHHADHFFPGRQDAAWDLAGAAIEFGLGRAAQAVLVDAYAKESGDRNAGARLPFYRLAYACWRLGYVRLAAQVLGDHPDAARFRRLEARYRRVIEREFPQKTSIMPGRVGQP